MNNFENRIEKLEKYVGKEDQGITYVVVVAGEPVPEDISERDTVIRVPDEQARQNILRLIAGERTKK